VLHPRRLSSSHSQPWEAEILHRHKPSDFIGCNDFINCRDKFWTSITRGNCLRRWILIQHSGRALVEGVSQRTTWLLLHSLNSIKANCVLREGIMKAVDVVAATTDQHVQKAHRLNENSPTERVGHEHGCNNVIWAAQGAVLSKRPRISRAATAG
jgi:hypothetical protein